MNKVRRGGMYGALIVATIAAASVASAGATVSPQRVNTSVVFQRSMCVETGTPPNEDVACHARVSLTLVPGEYLLTLSGMGTTTCTASSPGIVAVAPGQPLASLLRGNGQILVEVGPHDGTYVTSCHSSSPYSGPLPVNSLMITATPVIT